MNINIRQFCLLLLLHILLMPGVLLKGQVLKGKITDSSGDAIPYSTVYIRELRHGTTSNSKGDYEIRLLPGEYIITYQSLGYEPVQVNINISRNTITRDIVLPLQYYEIPEVRVSASGEDPAYIIMRKVIGLAPYYLNHVKYYKADVYLKGNLVVNRIPRLLKRSLRIEAGNDGGSSVSSSSIREGDTYLMESFNEIEFTAPDKYFQKVISFNSTFPEQGNEISPMDFIQASFYQPTLADIAISPLSSSAFYHYNFRYLGASFQGDYVINKIEVSPKRKSQQLFTGTIYIIEDLWCLHSVDLTNENLVGSIRIEQLYIPVAEEIWMPVSHKFEINIDIIGFRADAGYGSSVKYQEVVPNDELQRPETASTNYTGQAISSSQPADTVVSRTEEQINRIMEKDELTNRDMIKLARLMEKESDKSNTDSTGKSLEIKENTTYEIEEDAAEKDSAYWADIRPIPLSDIEIKSLRTSDSIKTTLSGISGNDSISSPKKQNRFFRRVRNIVVGRHTWSDTTGFSFSYSGLVNIDKLRFNPVDGFVYGMDLRFTKRWDSDKSLTIAPDFSWPFSREKLMWRVNTSFNFNGLKQSQIYFRQGSVSKDINNAGGINTLLNSVTSLLYKTNHLKLYESNYITFGYRSELVNGLTIELSANYDKRELLQNTTDFSIIKFEKTYRDNVPDNIYLDPGSNPYNLLSNQEHIDFVTKLYYVPYNKYRITNGYKTSEGSDWPTFIFSWTHGINRFDDLGEDCRHYDMFRFEAYKNHNLGALSNFRWRIRTGGFPDNREVPYYDFFHFNSQPLLLLINNYEDAFYLPEFYSLSTPELYGEIHIKYTTPYLLIKLLPVLSNTLMRENISFSHLVSRYHKSYSEIGYSISEFLLLGEVGLFVGFENITYKSIGARIVLRLN